MARARPFNLTAQINLRGPANIRTVVAGIRRQLGSVNANINVNIAAGAARSVTGLNTRLTRLNTTLANTRTNVNDVTAAINALSAAMRGLPPTPPIVPPGLPAATRNINAARTEMEEFGRQTGLAIRRFAAFSVGTAGIYALVNAITKGVESFISFNKEMVRLQQVTGESENSLKNVSKEITTLSTSLGVASSDLLNVATTLAQAGLSAKDTEKALKALALSALAPSFDDLNSTVEGSIALMRQFGISAGDLEGALGSINSVAAKFAVEAGDIISAIQRTGGVFASASKGVSEGTQALNEFVAIFTSVRQTTRESAETIATGLRTIFTRIQRAGTIEALKEFGITLTDAEGKFVGAYKAVELLSQGLNRLDPRNLKFSEIVEELGGFRQIGKVIPLIQQFATAQQALAIAQKGAGSLAQDAATAQLSLANQLSKVREEFFALFREIGESDSFQIMAKTTLALASGLIKLADAAKGVLPIIGTIMAVRGLQGIGQFAAGFRGGIRPGGGRGAASGGLIRYSNGGTVPAMVSNGEAFVPPETVKRIGVSKLKRMNQADRNGSRKYAGGGGIKVFKGPGSGTSDSIGPVNLPVGSFIIREKATKALGYSNGGSIQKFAGGTKKPLENRIREGMYGGTTAKSKAPNKKVREIYNFGVAALRAGTGSSEDILPLGTPKAGQISSKFFQPFKIPGNPKKGIPSRIGKFNIGTLSTIGLDNQIEDLLKNSFIKSVKRAASILSAKLNSKRKGGTNFINKVLQGSGFQGVIGSGLEAALALTGTPYLNKTEKTKSFDFPLGLGSASSLFGIPPNIPTDATRTIGGFGKKRSTLIDAARRFVESVESNEFTKAQQKIQAQTQERQTNKQRAINAQGGLLPKEMSVLGSIFENVPRGEFFGGQEIKKRFGLKYLTKKYLETELPNRSSKDRLDILQELRSSIEQDRLRLATKKSQRKTLGSMSTTQRVKPTRVSGGGYIQNFADAGPVEEYYGQKEVEQAKTARKALKKSIEMMFVDKKGRASFGVKRPVSISAGVSAAARKRFTKHGRMVSDIGTREEKLLVDKIIKTQATKLSKPKISGESRKKIAEKKQLELLGGMGAELAKIAPTGATIEGESVARSIMKAVIEGGRSSLKQEMLKLTPSSSGKSKVGTATTTGVQVQSLLKEFQSQAKNKVLISPKNILDQLPQAEVKLKAYKESLQKELDGTKDPDLRKSILRKLNKVETAITDIPNYKNAGVPQNSGRATAFAESIRQSGAIPGFAAGGLNKGISSNRAKEAILGKQLNGTEMIKAANRAGYKLSERDDGLIEFIKNGKITHTLSRKEASTLLGSLTTGSYKLGGEIPIMAQKGEYIINKKSAQSIGYGNLHKLNKYHTGGIVGDAPQKFFMGGGVDRDLIRELRAQGLRGNDLRREYERRKFRQRSGNTAFGLSMALPVIGEMISGNQEPTSAGAASNKAFTGTLSTGLGGALAVGSMGGPIGIITGLAVAAGSVVKAFADAKDAVREFNIKDATDKLNNQLELTSKSLDKFDKDINNIDTRTKALADVFSSIQKAQTITTASETKRTGVFNLFDDSIGAFERSVVLFDRGIFDYLQTTALFGGGKENALANQEAFFAKSIPKIAKERASQFGGASEASTRFLEAEIKRTGGLDALKTNKAEFEKLTSSLALADAQVQQEILNVQNNNALSDEAKDIIKKSIIARAGENKAIEIANRAMREKAIDELNKAASRASFSLELIFSEMEQSINASNFAIDKLRESSDLAAASLSGQAKIGQSRLNAINILQNPRAYSNQENLQASSLGASTFGPQLETAMNGLLKFGPMLQDVVMSTINNILTSTPKEELNNEMIGARISRAVRQSLDKLGLPPELATKLSSEVGKQIEELRKSGEDKVDFSQLIEKIPALANVVDSLKRAQESAIQSLENWQKNLNSYSDTFNKITDAQIQNNERLRRSSEILYQGQLELAKAFGKSTDLRGAINNFNATIASMSTGFTSVGDIAQEIQRLERIRQQQQSLQNDAANRGAEGAQDFILMTNNLKDTNVKLRESYAALELLSQSSEVAAAAMGRIAELQQKQQAGIGVMEKLITSTPEELYKFSGALQRLQANMMGRVNIGTTAEQRGESLQAFNMIAPLLGDTEGALKANVLESMLREANAPLTPFFSNILDSLRNPEADPQMKEAIDIYKESLDQQKSATIALNALNSQTIKINADASAQQINIGFENTIKSFVERQLVNIAAGIQDLVGIFKGAGGVKPPIAKANGGIIYADNGMFVPRGTDTVPAMLTPGEFVVNRQATQKNLPLLKSINNGSKGYSRGGVAYLAGGGLVSLLDSGSTPLAGYDYEIINNPKGGVPALQSSIPLYNLPLDFDKKLQDNIESAQIIKPVFYANPDKPLSLFPDSAMIQTYDKQTKDINSRLSALGSIKGRAALMAPRAISAFFDDTSKQGGASISSIQDSIDIPSANIINELANIISADKQPLTFMDNTEFKDQISKYKKIYENIKNRFLKFKNIENESINYDGKQIFSSIEPETFRPKVSNNNFFASLLNISKLSDKYLGPFLQDSIVAAAGIASFNPIGFAQGEPAETGYDAFTVNRFGVVSGTDKIGQFGTFYGMSKILGNSIYNSKDITDLKPTLPTDVAAKIPSIITQMKTGLDDLDIVTPLESEYSKQSSLMQKQLNALWNNQLFKLPIDSEKGKIVLYNIRQVSKWMDILRQVQNTQDNIIPDDNIATNNKKSWYKLLFDPNGGGNTLPELRLPWTKNLDISPEILTGLENEFKSSQDFIKEVSTKPYQDKNLMFNYQKIRGYLFDKKSGKFDTDGGIKDFLTIPFGGQSFAQNPFAGLPESNDTFGYFDDKSSLDIFINRILDETTKNPNRNEIAIDTILKAKDISQYGTFTDFVNQNTYLKKDKPLPINLPINKFIEAYNNKKRTEQLDQRFRVGGAGAGPVGNLFDLLNTSENLFDISSNTIRSPEISRIGGSLGYPIYPLRKKEGLGKYNDDLTKLISLLNNDRRAGKVRNYRGGNYTKFNENFIKLYSMAQASSELFKSLAAKDASGLSRIIGSDASQLLQNGALPKNNIKNIIEAVKNKASNMSINMMRGQAARPILDDTTNALDDILAVDREAIDVATFDASGAITGYNKATEQVAAGKKVQQISSLALNPYNFFKGNTRKTLIDNGVIKNIDNQLSQYRSNKRTPKDLIAKTYDIKNDVVILRDWFNSVHDQILNTDIPQDMILGSDSILSLKNNIDDKLLGGNNANIFDSIFSVLSNNKFNLSQKAFSRLTGGSNQLAGVSIPTPLLDFNRILDLLIERKNIQLKTKPEAQAAPGAPAAPGTPAPTTPVTKAAGGLIYASNGTLVNFKPRGTDTVPAMLTPGEFVINKQATQKNLPLLKAINSGQSPNSNYAIGGVVNSRTPTLDQNTINAAVANTVNEFQSTLGRIDKNTTSTKKDIDKLKSTNRFSTGGIVYASKGQLIGAQPKGTDTVPAMLTPGEFVVNRQATQKNLGLLKAINNGQSAGGYSSGGVVYLQDGGMTQNKNAESVSMEARWIDSDNPVIGTLGGVGQIASAVGVVARGAANIIAGQLMRIGSNIFLSEGGADLGIKASKAGAADIENLPYTFFESISNPKVSMYGNMDKNDLRNREMSGNLSGITGVFQGIGSFASELASPDPTGEIFGALKIASIPIAAVAKRIADIEKYVPPNTGNLSDIIISRLNSFRQLRDDIEKELSDLLNKLNLARANSAKMIGEEKSLMTQLNQGKFVTSTGKSVIDIPTVNFTLLQKNPEIMKTIDTFNKKYNTKYDMSTLGRLREDPNFTSYFTKAMTEPLSKTPEELLDRYNRGLMYGWDGESSKITLEKIINITKGDPQQISKLDSEIRGVGGSAYMILGPGGTRNTGRTFGYEKNIVEFLKAIENETPTTLMDPSLQKSATAIIEINKKQKLLEAAEKERSILQNAYSELERSKKPVIEAIKQAERLLEPKANIPSRTGPPPLPRTGPPPLPRTGPPPLPPSARKYYNGGIVYASNGRLINFEPRGTDTVPAMLTPGEFVVNRQATQNNLPLLQSINNGSNGYSNGGVVYLRDGGQIEKQLTMEGKNLLLNVDYKNALLKTANLWPLTRRDSDLNINNLLSPDSGDLVHNHELPMSISDFINKIKENTYASVEALNKSQAIKLAKDKYEWFDNTIKTPAASILLKELLTYQRKAVKNNQLYLQLYERDYNINKNLFEQDNPKLFSNESAELVAPGDDFKNYLKDSAKQQTIFSELYDRMNWLKLVYTNNKIGVQNLNKEKDSPETGENQAQYTDFINKATIQRDASLSEGRAIKSILENRVLFTNSNKIPIDRFAGSRMFDPSDPVVSNSYATILAKKYNRGGTVYASSGKMISYQPKGTDTVPAMLTPGEFVVNKQATQQNLSLLRSINSGAVPAYSSGGIAYLADGDLVRRKKERVELRYKEAREARAAAYEANKSAKQNAYQRDKQEKRARAEGIQPPPQQRGPVPNNTQTQNANNMIDFGQMGAFVKSFGDYVQQLGKIVIPSKIDMNVVIEPIQVVITGSAALESMDEGIKNMVASQINQKLGGMWKATDGGIGLNPATQMT